MSSASKRKPPKIVKVQKRTTQTRNHPMKTHKDTNIIIEEILNRLINDPNFSDITNDQLIDLQKRCDQKIKEYIQDHVYTEARKYQQLSQKISEEATKRIENPLFAPTENMFPTNRSIQSPHEQSRFKDFDEETSAMVDQLQAKHQRLMECFEDIWQTKIQPKYFQDSSRLNHLRTKFDESVALGDSNKAKLISDQIDKLEQEEEQINSEAFQKDYKQAKDALETKQSAQLTNLLAQRQKQRGQLAKKFNPVEPKPAVTRSLKLAQKPVSVLSAANRTIVIPKRQSTSQISQPIKKKEIILPPPEEDKTSEIGIQTNEIEIDDSMFEDPDYAIDEENRKRIEEQNRELTEEELDDFGNNVIMNIFDDCFAFLEETNIERKPQAEISLGAQSDNDAKDNPSNNISSDFVESSEADIDFDCDEFANSFVTELATKSIESLSFTKEKINLTNQMNGILGNIIGESSSSYSSESGE